jgi:uncharacterized protein
MRAYQKLSVDLPKERIDELCRLYGVEELSVFGSVLGADFHPGSDVDFLVTFVDNDAGPWGSKLTELEEELANALGRPVDVVTRPAVEHSRNWIIRKSILQNAQIIYGSRP